MIDSIRFRWEFELLGDAGRYVRSGPLALRQLAGDDPRGRPTDHPRVAYAIGRSVGGAVVRNRIRRRLRAILQQVDARGELRPGRYLFIVSPRAASASFDDLQVHVERLIGSS